MPKCNFCPNYSNGPKVLLKLKTSMLETLSLKPSLDYYACEDHFEIEAYTSGKRRRWVADAQLNVTAEDIVINKLVRESIASDHSYSKDFAMEEKDHSLDALDLKMGEDFFHDSQKISLREEVLEDNNNITDGAKQVNINN